MKREGKWKKRRLSERSKLNRLKERRPRIFLGDDIIEDFPFDDKNPELSGVVSPHRHMYSNIVLHTISHNNTQ